MKILLVSATSLEIQPLLNLLEKGEALNEKLTAYSWNGHFADVLIPGIGMTATAYWMGKALNEKNYDLALNFGFAGSFKRHLEVGTVVHVTKDRFPEMGAEAGEQLLPLSDLNLPNDDFVSNNTEVENTFEIDDLTISELPKAEGITVNTAHGNENSIGKLIALCNPDTESMEGGAFLYSCMKERVRCAQIRVISNYVASRDKQEWNIPLAVSNLNEVAVEVLKSLMK